MAAYSDARVIALIAKELDVAKEKVVPKARFIEDLSADSLDVVELVMALEDEFEVDIPDEDADKIKTVEEAMEYLRTHVTA